MKTQIKIVLALIVITIAHFVVHEFAHASVAKLLGYDVIVTLNSVKPVTGYDSTTDASIISIAGPIVTIVIGMLAAVYARQNASIIAFLVVVSAVFQRTMAQVVSIANPNDEMRVSIDMGLGAISLPLLSIGLLVAATVYAWRGPKPKGWVWFSIWLGLSLGSSAAVFSEYVLPSITW